MSEITKDPKSDRQVCAALVAANTKQQSIPRVGNGMEKIKMLRMQKKEHIIIGQMLQEKMEKSMNKKEK